MRRLSVSSSRHSLFLAFFLALLSPLSGGEPTARLAGRVVDAATGELLPSRLYVRDADGGWHHARSSSDAGSAVEYRKVRLGSVEIHTTLSAHPFVVDLPPGEYTLIAERGKEYFPAEEKVNLERKGARVTLRLRRWVDTASRGWYSGDTHVHRGLDELPNILLAEDLNVAFPLVHWVTRAFEPPGGGDADGEGKGERGEEPSLIEIDPTHVIWPRNTEYEIFTVGERRHTLGAVFLLGHRSIFDAGVPPVRPVARKTHREGGLVELDKHAWPWSMVLVPVMDVDLYELSNNHLWRAEFAFRNWGEPPAEYMDVERKDGGMTERGWIEYGLENYYALLQSGFRLRPTAGTASGVHPVPLGFGRVYVRVDGPFRYDAWLRGLDRGRSFVTTGPMLFATVNGREPGEVFEEDGPATYAVRIEATSETPLETIEVVAGGARKNPLEPANERTAEGAYRSVIETDLRIERSSWIAVRAFEKRPGGRCRFAHTGPFHVVVGNEPPRPRREQIDFLIERVEREIERSRELLPPEALAEYRKALEAYREVRERSEGSGER